MRIAVCYDGGEVFGHFGHTEKFKLYDVENGKITAERMVSAEGSGHGALASLLDACGADALICGGIGGGARAALAEYGIEVYGGVSGSADEAAVALIEGRLSYNPDIRCAHHGEHDCKSHSEHGCAVHGDHDCGGHN